MDSVAALPRLEPSFPQFRKALPPHQRLLLSAHARALWLRSLSLSLNPSQVLGDCGASFAAMAHWARHTKVMDEFEAIRLSQNTEEPDELAKQEAAYRADAEYMKAVDTGRARMIDGELLVRSNDEAARQLGSAWMRAYLRGADRDQPAFAYAFFKAVIEPCTLTGGDCNVACGGGKVNLLQHASRGGCGTESEKGWWGTAPAWVCSCDGPGCYARREQQVRAAEEGAVDAAEHRRALRREHAAVGDREGALAQE